MDLLVQQITERTGISESQAREAVQMVAGFIKTQLPAPIAAQVDAILSGQGGENLAGQAQQMLGNLGDMFGKQ
ncbi:MAG TPA: hypothetical protein VFZ66_25690 [Herpetosiphonaceae bacterium]